MTRIHGTTSITKIFLIVILFLEYRLEDCFLDLLLDCLSYVLYQNPPVQIFQDLLLFSEGNIKDCASILMMIVVDHLFTFQSHVWHPCHLTSLGVATSQTESVPLPVGPERFTKLKQKIIRTSHTDHKVNMSQCQSWYWCHISSLS